MEPCVGYCHGERGIVSLYRWMEVDIVGGYLNTPLTDTYTALLLSDGHITQYHIFVWTYPWRWYDCG